MQRYSVYTFGGMIGPRSKPRVDAYAEALRRSITPGCTVLDIGTGPGFFAILAAKLGAGHVYGVDPNPVLDLARELATANGVADRTTFIGGLSTDVELPRRADVIISDIRGSLPWLHGHIPSIVDARERLLAPGGVLIPRRDRVWGSLVHAPEIHALFTAPWDDNEFGLDLAAARRRATDHVRRARVQGDALIGGEQMIAEIDYRSVVDPDVDTELRWTIEEPATGHGLLVWFDAELADGVGFSNAPDEPHIPIYSETLFPWREAVELESGDTVAVRFRARLARSRYVWNWATRVRGPGGEVCADFAQATINAADSDLEAGPNG